MSLGRVTLRVPFGLVMISMVLITCATSASGKDKNECTEQLIGLATCLPYVGETAKLPTPDCCNGLKQVLNTNKKCLCVIVKDRNDPDLGLSINVTLALGLPSVCHAPANISQCPELLHLAPNSPDAQVFYQFGHGSGAGAGASASATSPISSVNGNTRSANSTGTSASNGIMKRLVDWKVIVGGAGAVLLWGFTSN